MVGSTAEILTFLIADVRGYTSFTQVRGDEAAACLAMTFAEVATEAVEARNGRVIGLRGDEALAVFASARQALRAAVDLQLAFLDEMELDPAIPLRVGIGIDAGEAVPVSDGYRGGALNLAARLCSKAEAGEVLASQGVLHLARATDGLRFIERGEVEMKGLAEPVRVLQVVAEDYLPADISRRIELVSSADGQVGTLGSRTELPPELDPMTPLLGRDVDARWIRWAWRLARRGPWRAVALTGPEGVGKTRLAAEAASLASANGARLAYASARDGRRLTKALSAGTSSAPSLLVLEDLDAATDEDLASVAALFSEGHEDRTGLLVLTAHEDAPPGVLSLLRHLAGEDGIRQLAPLDSEGVRAIVDLYASSTDAAAPVQAILEAAGGLPAAVHDLAGRWAQNEASRRLGEATSRAALGRTDLRQMESQIASDVVDLQRARERTLLFGASKAPTDVCPFKGLVSFDVADTEFFFGRERLIAEMVARLAGSAFLGVVGPSGSGKSSAVRAGLVPAIGAGVLPRSEFWLRAIMRPGENPMRSLDRAVYAALPEDARIGLSGSDDPLRAALEQLPNTGRLLLVVDQFEEAFTSCGDEEERRAFFGALARAACDDAEHVVVVVAVRADFYGRCAAYPALAELLGPNHVLVGPMTADEYRRAIEGPARRAGLRIEPALVDALVTDVVDEPGGLPLLSTALVELWGHREGRRISMEAYVRSGGVKGAVGRLAEEAYAGLTEEQQAIARSVLLRLAGAGEGDAVVRRRVPLAEFDAENDDVARVLDVLTERRLVTVSEGTVEVSHEALLREWGRLQDWLEEDRQGRRLRQHLIESAKEWASADRETSELYRGARLASALDWTTEHTLELNELERDFLNQSRATSERETERQRRTNRRLRTLLMSVAAFLVLALVTGSLAFVQRGRARRSALVALSQSLGSRGVIEPRLDRGLLLAREAVNLDVSNQTRSSLLATVLRAPAAVGVFYGGDTGRRPLDIALSPDGATLAVGYNVRDLELFSTSSFSLETTITDGAGGPPVFSPDGSLLAVPSPGENGRANGSVELRDPTTGRSVRTLSADPMFSGSVIGFRQLAFSADGDELFGLVFELHPKTFAPRASYIVRWDVATGELLSPTTTVSNGEVSGFGITSQGQIVVAGEPTTIWDSHTMALEGSLKLGGARSLGVSPDGATMVLGESTGSVRFVDLRTGHQTVGAGGHTAAVQSIGFTPDSRTAISTGADGNVLIWDVASATVSQTLNGHAGKVAAQANDGRTLYTSSQDGTIFAWDLSGTRRLGQRLAVGSGNESLYWGSLPWFALSPDGSTLAVTEGNGYVNFWNLTTLRRVQSFRAVPHGLLMSVHFSPDGKTLAATGTNGQLLLWDLTSSPPTSRRLTGLPHTRGSETIFWATFTADGTRVAAADWQQVFATSLEGEVGGSTAGDLAVWDARSGELVRGPIHFDGGVSDVEFSPDGRTMAVALATGYVPLIDVNTMKAIRTFHADTVPPTTFDTFSPDGRLLATGGWSGVVRLWDVASGQQVTHFLASAGPVIGMAFDPEGELIATTGTDGATRLWDATTGIQFGATFPGFDNVWNAVAFTPDGSRLVVVYANGQAFVWPATWQAWAAHACAVAGRGFSRSEWRTFVGDRPYEPVCSAGSP